MSTPPRHPRTSTPPSTSRPGGDPPDSSSLPPTPASAAARHHRPPPLTPAATAPASIGEGATGSGASYSYLGSMWTGLIRRFSAEDGDFPSPTGASPSSGSQRRQHHHKEQQQGKDGINGVYAPPVVRRLSPFRPPPLDPLVLHGYRDSTPVSARLLTAVVAEEIRTMVPERLRIVEDWRLVYSLEQDGASLATLYQKCRHYEGRRVGFILVVKDEEGGTFGAYLSEYPHPAPSYFGNGECFLWRASTLASLPPPPSADTTNLTRNTTLAPAPKSAHGSGTSTPSESIRFKAFPYSGLNDCYINCEAGFLSVGSGGGHYGLWLDDSLDIGHSSQCDTFGNEPLSDTGEKFGVLGVELWVVGAT
ncbi:Oxidation resistance protein 1 [Hirsutella minnesotensis 3608]|uniref:Oxidation resistance protein 1 n=1 Tax=Hirsutella minnesotensis 3608 TaxID=1043627 RepID=A0A0F7ZMQ0_9HYPO|nr:Oxidation resistance protein 1 [Hirsutella minnesotensis 3608]